MSLTTSPATPFSSTVPAAIPAPKTSPKSWREPRPNRWVMWALGFVNRWLLLRGWFRVRTLRLTPEDATRLTRVVSRDTVAFLGPNHPEFGTDWMVDKELSTFVAPNMASWADRGIVNSAPAFWGMNNLVANDGGEAAKAYSVRVALRGDGVLLHPEGSVRWTNDHVHSLFPGIAQMALTASRMTEKPVYIVPVVWKFAFTGDVSRRIAREMRIIERALSLPNSEGDVPTRFLALQESVLSSRMERFAYRPTNTEADFFTRQSQFQRWLLEELERRWTIEPCADAEKRASRFARAIRSAMDSAGSDHTRLRRELAITEEIKRLGEFSRAIYGTPTLTQEQISESLKRIRDRLVRRGWRNTIARMLPRPLGARVAYVGVAEGIRVDGSLGEEELLRLARTRMQEKLDEMRAIAARETTHAGFPNPFCR